MGWATSRQPVNGALNNLLQSEDAKKNGDRVRFLLSRG
jgi:hypothetical protein